MESIIRILLLLLGLAKAQDMSWVNFDRSKFDKCTFLDDDSKVTLCWSIDEDTSKFGMASKSSGYLALGMSDNGSMKASDIALFYQKDGEYVLENRRAEDFDTPQLVEHQALTLLEGRQENGVTGFVFERNNTAQCYSQQNDVDPNSWQFFLYAYSDSNEFQKHDSGKRGFKQIDLNPPQEDTEAVDLSSPDIQTIEIRTPVNEITSNVTTYCSSVVKLPSDKKYHIVAEEALIESPYLHHAVLYECVHSELSEDEIEKLSEKPICGNQAMISCSSFFSIIVPNMTRRVLPPNMGKPMSDGSNKNRVFLLEIHYNNPKQVTGDKDNSGIKFYYTEKLRPVEIGVLTLAKYPIDGYTLPPRQDNVDIQAVCPSECTEDTLPDEGITVLSHFFHMHLTGKKAQTRIIRDGKELPLLGKVDGFSYDFQTQQMISPTKILPGDRLELTCTFDTSDHDEPVQAGYATFEEMCFDWIEYYPIQPLKTCTTVPNPKNPKQEVGLCDATSRKNRIIPEINLDPSYEPLIRDDTCPVNAVAKITAPSSSFTSKPHHLSLILVCFLFSILAIFN